MRIRAILPLVGMLLIACLFPATTPTAEAPPVSGLGRNALTGHTGPVDSVAWSPDGKELASGSDDKTIMVWDVASGKLQATLTGHTGSVYSVAWSPDGEQLASGSQNMAVIVWDVASAK
jgi:WD40 repeat protein